MATWDDVRELALALPEVEEGTSYRKPSFKVSGRWLGGESPHEPGALVLRCDLDELPFMLGSSPDVYFTTPHYAGHALVLVRVDAIDRDQLRVRLEDSWALAAPKRLLDRDSGG